MECPISFLFCLLAFVATATADAYKQHKKPMDYINEEIERDMAGYKLSDRKVKYTRGIVN